MEVSWVDGYGNRMHGTFHRWDGDFALVKQGVAKTWTCRIHKSNLTVEEQAK